jgi:hypothetical protein
MITADKQRSPKGVYQANRIPWHMGGHRRQKLLTEYQQSITRGCPSVAKPANSDNEKRRKSMPRTKRVQSRGGGSTWVCNLSGAKQVNNGPVSDKEITADRCAKCSNPLVGSYSPTHCLRCNTVKYCNDTCKHTGSKVTGRRVHQVILGAQRVGRASILTRKHLPPVQDVRRWCTARIDASTVTSTVTCTNAPWCYLQ